jgi:SIR2-like domain
MDIGNFSKCVLLTGAGWSRNWGARLAAGVWELLMDDADVASNDRLRALLLEEPSFEVALAKTQLPTFTPDDQELFTRALVNGFISMDRAMMRPFDGSPGAINIYKVQELILRFAGQLGQQFGTSYFFTLNQDLFPERFLYNQHVSAAPPLTLPGIQPVPGVQFFATNLGVYTDHFIQRPVSDLTSGRLSGQFNIIKLHGSFNWRTADARNVLVVGTDKTRQIADFPLLSWYSDIFKAVLDTGDVRLMIVGYGFGDEHINAVIAEAVEKRGLKVFVWSNTDPKDRILAAPHGREIWKGLLSTETQQMVEVFPPNQDITEEYRRIQRVFFHDRRF